MLLFCDGRFLHPWPNDEFLGMPVPKGAVRAVWGQNHPFVHVIRKLNPHRNPFDSEVHARQILRRRTKPQQKRRALAVKDADEEDVQQIIKSYQVPFTRAALQGEATSHETREGSPSQFTCFAPNNGA